MKKILRRIATGLISAGLLVNLVNINNYKFVDNVNAQEKITLKYANWNFGSEGEENIELMMIDAFNASQNEIEVVIDESIDTSDWTGSLATVASASNLPDVFMLDSIPTAVSNDWLYDLSKLTESDEEFSHIPLATAESVIVSDKVVAIPFATHMFGYYVNMDLLEAQNLSLPESPTTDEFIELIKAVNDLNQGVVGLQNASNILDWLPGAIDPNLGWFTFNTEEGTYSIDSPEMAQALNTARDLGLNNYVFDSLSEEEKESLGGTDSHQMFLQGHIAFKYDGTWMLPSMEQDTNFNWKFIGIPGERSAIVNDYLGIAKNTEHPEAAYKFAKFMSFGTEGFNTRLDLAEEKQLPLSTLPISADDDISERYWNMIDAPGVADQYALLDNAMIDPFKVVPGYAESRFDAPTGVTIEEFENATVGQLIDLSVAGKINFQDYSAQIQEIAQSAYDKAEEAIR